MSFLNPTRTCVFSAVKARLTRQGAPLSGIAVIRRWNWHDKREDRATTNAQGEFAFPAVFESSVSRLLPIEIVISQSLYAVVNGEEQLFWVNAKRNDAENGEYEGHPTHLACELTHEMKLVEGTGNLQMLTLCTLVD